MTDLFDSGHLSGRISQSEPDLQRLPKVDSPEGAAILAAFARGGGYVLNQAHKALMERHGVDIGGIIFNDPIPVDFSSLEEAVYIQQWGRAYRPGSTKKAVTVDIETYNDNTDEPLDQQLKRLAHSGLYEREDDPVDDAMARFWRNVEPGRALPKRSPVAKAKQLDQRRKANKAARKARRK